MHAGPYINLDAIPTGNPGVSYVNVSNTSEQAPAAHDGVGAFRTVCQFSHMNFDDPIVYPGKPGEAHLHTWFGNAGGNAFSTASSLRSSGNGTCRGGTLNRSAYWVPAVVNSQGVPQAPIEMHVYYKSGYYGIPASKINRFPQGLRMIAGDAKATAKQSHAYWGCLNNSVGQSGNIPSCRSDDQVVMSVAFPQCWNGKDLDSADHKSHMAYPVNGACPSTHPVAIPAIEFHVRYRTPPEGTQGWRLSSDHYASTLPGGYSAHADWFEGWDSAAVDSFTNNCIRPAKDCHSHLLGDGRQMN